MEYLIFDAHCQNTIAHCLELARLKGGEYASGKDRLANFKDAAEALGIDPLTVWLIYADKHWTAVKTYVKDQQTGMDRERSEPIQGRFHDMIVYALLGLALIEDKEAEC